MNKVPKTNVELGDFPFPIIEGPQESRYLTWVRNHSNYMVVRGPLDYLRAIGVLLRGILVNFLIFVPYLLGISLVVAASNLLQEPPPFIFTKGLLILVVAWILLFPVLMPLFKIVRYRKSRATGSDSSVKQRDLYERSFGALLLAILAVAAFESLPGLLDVFHDQLYESDYGWPTFASTMAVAAAIFSIAPKLLSVLGRGVARNLALVVIAALGVLVPLLFVLFVSDFLVFGPPRDWTLWLKLAGRVFPLGIMFAVVLGLAFGAFKRKDFLNISLLLVGAFGLLGLGIFADKFVLERYLGNTAAALRNEAIAELPKHPREFEKLTADVAKDPGPELEELGVNLEEYREYIVQKRDFLAQRSMDPNPSPEGLSKALEQYRRDNSQPWGMKIFSALKRYSFTQQPMDFQNFFEYLEKYHEFRATYAAFDEPVPEDKPAKWLEELLGDLLEELANEAYNVEGLSPLVKLADAIDPSAEARPFAESAALMSEVQSLYRRAANLRDLYRPQPLRELATKLITLPYEDIETLYGGDYPLLQKLDEFAEVEKSLVSWSSKLKKVRGELDAYAPYSPNLEFFKLIENVADQPSPRLKRLSEDLAEYRENLSQQRYWFSQQSADDNQSFEALLKELANVGYNAGLYPEFGRLVDAIDARPIKDPPALKRELHNLYSSATTVRDLYKSQSLRELASYLITLPKQDLDTLYDMPYGDYPLLQEFDELDEVRNMLDWGPWLYTVRDELAATASILLFNSAFYATPAAKRVRINAFWPKFIFVSMLAVQLWFLCWLTVDVNLTSIHGLYRDRLASAFLVGEDTKGDIDIEKDLDLMEICCHEAGSIAPYHLVNVALNLQGSKDIGIRDRNCDFFIFSKRFIGGERTGYCRSETMEQVFPQMDLATAMAISAAAASPNMGRGTSPALVAVMTLLNIRLGFWVPNPGLLENWLAQKKSKQKGEERKQGFSFDEVFREELKEIEARWAQLPSGSERHLAADNENRGELQPTPEHGLVGIGFSGGGIRSATINLGITQALHRRGVFDHVDYMSTVSGGGYLGSSISTLMRRKTQTASEIVGTAETKDAEIAAKEGDAQNSVGQLFRWRVRPGALMWEILSKLDETSRWVNVSDGGHIENLAGIELLRRHCQYIIIGDGEADPDHHFNGLATLIQTARIDLGIHIDIKVDPIRLRTEGLCREHWAIGRIHYPWQDKRGYLLYIKSSVTGDEDEVIQQYRHRSPSFPHESTADQFFGEGQFEAYRSLGQHIGEQVLEHATCQSDLPNEQKGKTEEATQTAATTPMSEDAMSFADLDHWFEALYRRVENKAREGTSV